jgi:predicted enzyme related to lactoylglutathione lyase
MPQAAARQTDHGEASQRTWSHGTFYWNELLTRDPEQGKKFYGATLGWTFEPFPMADGGTYWIANAGTRMAGGIFVMTDPEFAGVPEGWMSYIAVDDVDARVGKAIDAGARLMRPLFDVPGVGRIAILTEPCGAGIGWMTPAPAAA